MKHSIHFFKIFYLLESQSCRERRRERWDIFCLLFTPQMASTAKAEPSWSQKPGVSSASPICVQDFENLGHFCCFPRDVSRELDLKWSSIRLPGTHIRCWHHRWQLCPVYHTAGPRNFLFVHDMTLYTEIFRNQQGCLC